MSTAHEDAVEVSMRACITGTPMWAETLYKFWDLMEQNESLRWYFDLIGTHYKGVRSLTLPQVHAAVLVNGMLHSGEVKIATINLREVPLSDSQEKGNQAKLLRLPSPFEALVCCERGRGADDDGQVAWRKPARFDPLSCEGGDEPEPCPCTTMAPEEIRQGCVPLEIGTTLPSKTLVHLKLDGGVARWPYGSEKVYVMKTRTTTASRIGAALNKKETQQ